MCIQWHSAIRGSGLGGVDAGTGAGERILDPRERPGDLDACDLRGRAERARHPARARPLPELDGHDRAPFVGSFAEFAAHTKKRMGDAYTANMEPALREAYKVAEAQRERILAEVTGKIALAKSASDRALAYAGLGEKQAEEAAEKKDN